MSRVVVAWYPRSAKASTAATSSRLAASGVTSAHGALSPSVSSAVLIVTRPSRHQDEHHTPNLSKRLGSVRCDRQSFWKGSCSARIFSSLAWSTRLTSCPASWRSRMTLARVKQEVTR